MGLQVLHREGLNCRNQHPQTPYCAYPNRLRKHDSQFSFLLLATHAACSFTLKRIVAEQNYRRWLLAKLQMQPPPHKETYEYRYPSWCY